MLDEMARVLGVAGGWSAAGHWPPVVWVMTQHHMDTINTDGVSAAKAYDIPVVVSEVAQPGLYRLEAPMSSRWGMG